MSTGLSIQQYEQLNPFMEVSVDDRQMIFNTPNSHTAWRVNSLFEKEPDTIAWLESFEEHAVLYDIGANVGMYSIYAAIVRGAKVLAFEPESQNFALLNKNIFSNKLAGLVTAYPVALSSSFEFSSLYLSGFIAGGSCHNFGESVDFNDKPFQSDFEQGCLAIPLDRLISDFGFPAPDHIKIDVDGLEHKV
ncbi:MAG: FkbM family methyltransferase, partial [Halieaceae bacterium]